MAALTATRSEFLIAKEEQYGAHNYHPLEAVIERGRGVHVWDVEGNKYRPNPNLATTSSRSYSFSGLGGGDYRVTVSLKNEGATANTVFSVPGDGGSGILWVLLLILAAGAIGYWFWNKKRQKKLDDNKINKPEDLFSAGGSSGATGASGQGNSGYF